MKPLFELILQPVQPVSKISNKRQWIISQFLEELNGERKEPWKASYIAFRLSHLKVSDLEYMFSICQSYKKEGKGAFGKCFWGSLKVK